MNTNNYSGFWRIQNFVKNQPKPLSFGVLLLAPFIIFSIAPSFFAPYSPLDILDEPFMSPSSKYILGTDEIGRDLLSRAIFAARADILTSLSAASVAFILGTLIGLFSGQLQKNISKTAFFCRTKQFSEQFSKQLFLHFFRLFFSSSKNG